MKKQAIFLFLLTIAMTAHSIPAMRGIWKTITLKDGKKIKVELRGDEFLHFWQAADGSRYMNNGDGFVTADMEALRKRSKELRGEQAGAQTVMNAKASSQQAGEQTPLSFIGDKRCIILLVQFSDMKFSMDDPQAFYTKVANEPGFNENQFRGSVADYFKDQSNGQFRITFDVVGPYTLSNYASYGANNASGGDSNPRTMISSACQAAYNAGVDFTPYDWDGDGEVEMVYVLYAGRGEATGGDDDTVWPHKSIISPLRLGSVYVQTYACSNELRTATTYEGIGTICHEFSHCLGYPDIYDTDYAENGQYYGMGSWDLMSGGNYNGNGFCPAGYTAYEKWMAGWIDFEELDEDISVTGLKPISEGGVAYRMTNPGNANEYYLIENRQLTGWDAELPAGGVLINHIDYDERIWSYNVPNTIGSYNDHERITIIPADNVKSSSTESGDPWPYGMSNTLSNSTSPAAEVYNKNVDGTKYMNISISNIAINNDGEASFDFINYNKSSSQEGYIMRETFDKCQGTGGNDSYGFTPPLLGSFASGTFLPDVEGWTSEYMGGASRCARFGNNYNTGLVTSPEFTLDGRETTVTFKAAPYGTDGTSLTLSVNGNAVLGQTSFTMESNQWTEFTTTINGTGTVSLTFTPSNRLFLDEVAIPDPGAASIKEIEGDRTATRNKGVYSIDGRKLGDDTGNLPNGVYIVNGKKFLKTGEK